MRVPWRLSFYCEFKRTVLTPRHEWTDADRAAWPVVEDQLLLLEEERAIGLEAFRALYPGAMRTRPLRLELERLVAERRACAAT